MIEPDTIAADSPMATLDFGLPVITIAGEDEAWEVHLKPHPDPTLVTAAIVRTSPTESPELFGVRAHDWDDLRGELFWDALWTCGVALDASAHRGQGRAVIARFGSR